MDFLKKHYEKVILSVVLIGLAAFAAWLPIKIGSDREELRKSYEDPMRVTPAPLPPWDATKFDATLQGLKTPQELDFSTVHRVFNPVKWIQRPDGRREKVSETNFGPGALRVVNIRPLRLIVGLDKVAEGGGGYHVAITRENAPLPQLRKKQVSYATLNGKLGTNSIYLREIKGPSEDPTELVFEFDPSKERFSVFKDKPFVRVEAYAADLKYPPENDRLFTNRWRGQTLVFDGDTNKIVDISASNVVVSAPNGKNTTIPWNAAP